jgi:hypothetical protein
MNRLAAAIVFLGLMPGPLIAPCLAQIITVNPTPPPCTGEHCVNQLRGARVEHHGAVSIQRASCPAGTVYNARKGTCKVLN